MACFWLRKDPNNDQVGISNRLCSLTRKYEKGKRGYIEKKIVKHVGYKNERKMTTIWRRKKTHKNMYTILWFLVAQVQASFECTACFQARWYRHRAFYKTWHHKCWSLYPPSCPKEYICMIHQENIPPLSHASAPTCLYDRILGNVCALKDDLCSHTTQQRRVESARVIQ